MPPSLSTVTMITTGAAVWTLVLTAPIHCSGSIVGTVILAPFALGVVGFTGAGIAAGSTAAGMMSSAAIANGGSVAAGSLVAILQSAGAAGLSATATAGVASVGGATGALVGGAIKWLKRMRK